ncbi:MAG: cupredoxin domain-containing protein [Actinomycetota bacterium]
MRSIAVLMVPIVVLAGCGRQSTKTPAAGSATDTGTDQRVGSMGGGAECTPSGTSLSIAAKDTAYDKACLAAPAGQAFTINFDNKDALQHSITIAPKHTSKDFLFRGEIVEGPKMTTYNVSALQPGTFHFHCEVHPQAMQGTFVVK